MAGESDMKFRFDATKIGPPWLYIVAFAIPFCHGLTYLSGGSMFRGSILVVFPLLALHVLYWRRRTPIVVLKKESLLLFKSPYRKPRAVSYQAISSIDETSLVKTRIYYEDGQTLSIRRAWFRYPEYSEFMQILKGRAHVATATECSTPR
jgi:hypothetical protein